MNEFGPMMINLIHTILHRLLSAATVSISLSKKQGSARPVQARQGSPLVFFMIFLFVVQSHHR
jgi:hypothetical protein